MAPKRGNTRDVTPSAAATTQAGPTTAGTVPAGAAVAKPQLKPSALATKEGWKQVIYNVWNHYVKTTPQRTKLLDLFMLFLVVVGALQFVYCVLAGNYVSPPRDAILQAVGVLTLWTAIQCLSLWLLCNSRPIRSDR